MDLYNLVVSAKITKGGGGGDEPVLIDKSIDANGTYKASDDSADGYKKVTVSVPSSGITPVGTKNITENGVFDVTDFASASVSVPVGVFPSGTSSITANGIYNIESFASVDVNVSGGGGGEFDALIEGTLTTINTNASGIGSQAFYSNGTIQTVIAPNASRIGSYAFYRCDKLSAINMPSVSRICQNAFTSCTSLTTADFPNVTTIESYAFSSCSKLVTASFPMLTQLPEGTFYGCSSLSNLYLPKVSIINNYAFASCISLPSAINQSLFPSVSDGQLGSYAFTRTKIAEFDLPVNRIGNCAFSYCSQLSKVRLPSCSSIGNSAFVGCSKLMQLYMLSTSVASTSNTAFSSTPMSNSTYTGSFGSIYVPASLVDSYKTAANWSAYSARITSYVE